MRQFNKTIKRLLKESEGTYVAKKTMEFFYGLKTLLERGDDFKIVSHNLPNAASNTTGCRFMYNGTRTIHVLFRPLFRLEDNLLKVFDVVVNVLEDGNRLDCNFFRDEDFKMCFDPNIKTVHQFVDYIRAVLDRNERDEDPERPQPPPPNVSNLHQQGRKLLKKL